MGGSCCHFLHALSKPVESNAISCLPADLFSVITSHKSPPCASDLHVSRDSLIGRYKEAHRNALSCQSWRGPSPRNRGSLGRGGPYMTSSQPRDAPSRTWSQWSQVSIAQDQRSRSQDPRGVTGRAEDAK